jgi:hypothetical protein
VYNWNFKKGIKTVKSISTPLWFLGIILVYAIIMKVKSDIKPQNEQNIFCIGGEQPLPPPHDRRNFGVCSLDKELRVLVLFSESAEGLETNQPQRGVIFRGEIFCGGWGVNAAHQIVEFLLLVQ